MCNRSACKAGERERGGGGVEPRQWVSAECLVYQEFIIVFVNTTTVLRFSSMQDDAAQTWMSFGSLY